MTEKSSRIRSAAVAALVVNFVTFGFAPAVQASDDTVHVIVNPEAYLVGRGPAQPIGAAAPERAQSTETRSSVEKAAAVIPGNFTVIPNATPGLLDNFSFVRFPNFNPDITSTANVKIVGDATGRDYGTAQVVSAPFSSPQLSITNLMDSIEAGPFDPADTTVTLYIQSNQFLTGVQHVYYNQISDFFENMSVCSFVDGISNVPTTIGVVNIHTTTLQSRFPSVVKIHNKNPVATTLTMSVHDGPTGVLRGKFSFLAQPNSTYAFSAPQLQANVGYIPTPDDFHMNVFFDAPAEAPPNATISHTVTNVRVSGSVLNLTTICTIND
ncbi:MAG: hypothetical protein JNK21_12705 [Rhodospirillaceae bacterium]|nr:hypothetical protein [Rhodospirillaceae bacterium]